MKKKIKYFKSKILGGFSYKKQWQTFMMLQVHQIKIKTGCTFKYFGILNMYLSNLLVLEGNLCINFATFNYNRRYKNRLVNY